MFGLPKTAIRYPAKVVHASERIAERTRLGRRFFEYACIACRAILSSRGGWPTEQVLFKSLTMLTVVRNDAHA